MVAERHFRKYMRLFVVCGVCLLVLFAIANSDYQKVPGSAITLADDRILKSVPYQKDYCAIYDVWRASDEYRSGDHVTLVHHATPKYLSYLKDQLDSWDGGISLSVFIPTPRAIKHNNEITAEAQIQLQVILEILDGMIEEKNSQRVGLHLFFEKGVFPRCPEIRVPKMLLLTPEMEDLADFAPSAELYPINPARNIARLGSHTEYFISGDIEQIFVPNSEKRLYKLAKSVMTPSNPPLALVYRRFEIAEDAPVPKNKKDLTELLKKRKAIPFHQKIYAAGHRIGNFSEWLAHEPLDDSATIQFNVSYKNAEWEPQFVADSRAPFHDDRFPFRLRSNTHLGSLMCHMGFKFAIVNDIFTYHRGIKVKTTESENALKKISFNNGYKKMVKKYNIELREKYPEKKSVCPLIVP